MQRNLSSNTKEDLSLNGCIILKWILTNQDMEVRTDSAGSEWGQMADCLSTIMNPRLP